MQPLKPKKNQATSWAKKSRNLLDPKKHAFSGAKKSGKLSGKKNPVTSQAKKNNATSWSKKNHETSWAKKKIMQPLEPEKKSRNLSGV
jgi:hypothetical protein